MRRKLLILVAVMAVIVASCGGGGSSSTATEPPAVEVESTGGTGDIIAADKNESGKPADKLGAGEATGVVTVGDTRYDFAFSGESDVG